MANTSNTANTANMAQTGRAEATAMHPACAQPPTPRTRPCIKARAQPPANARAVRREPGAWVSLRDPRMYRRSHERVA
eukprot:6209565-Prymnesium_polylepis.1